MQLDISQQLYDLEGRPIKYPEWDEEGKAKPDKDWKRLMTLKSVLLDALMSPAESDKSLVGEDKVKLYDLALRVHRSDTNVLVDDKEIGTLKERVDKAFPHPMVVGQVWKMLDDLESVKNAEENGTAAKKGSTKKGS